MLALRTMRIFAAKIPPYFVGALLIPFRFATIPLLARDALPSRFYAASTSASAAPHLADRGNILVKLPGLAEMEIDLVVFGSHYFTFLQVIVQLSTPGSSVALPEKVSNSQSNR
jgi:hypothetical protein